jgi:putative ubiquitin-RnfH superfamily antitoxin RatB of RatAB toxin-antitoxin module
MPIRVSVVYSSKARHTYEEWVTLDDGARVLQAVQASGVLQRFPEIDLARAPVGIWGRKTSLDQPLHERDRIEIYRPLSVDPKVARRERFRKQGARAAGLFAKKRPGTTPGE